MNFRKEIKIESIKSKKKKYLNDIDKNIINRMSEAFTNSLVNKF